MDDLPKVDPAKLFEDAPKVLAQLAALTLQVFEAMKTYHIPTELKAEAGNATALIVSLYTEKKDAHA